MHLLLFRQPGGDILEQAEYSVAGWVRLAGGSLSGPGLGPDNSREVGTQLRIDPTGDVYPCRCFHGGREFLLANVRTGFLSAMVRGEKLRRIKELRRRRPLMVGRCRQCRWQGYCGGGCMGGDCEISGDILASPACEVRRQLIESRFATIMEQMK